MVRREGAINRAGRHRGAVQFDQGHVDVTGSVASLVPQALAVAVQRYRKAGRAGNVVRVDMQLDLDAVGKVLAGFVDHHVAAGDEVEAPAACKEKAARIRERPVPVEAENLRRGQQQRVDHRGGDG